MRCFSNIFKIQKRIYPGFEKVLIGYQTYYIFDFTNCDKPYEHMINPIIKSLILISLYSNVLLCWVSNEEEAELIIESFESNEILNYIIFID